jgi:hypothetical protein
MLKLPSGVGYAGWPTATGNEATACIFPGFEPRKSVSRREPRRMTTAGPTLRDVIAGRIERTGRRTERRWATSAALSLILASGLTRARPSFAATMRGFEYLRTILADTGSRWKSLALRLTHLRSTVPDITTLSGSAVSAGATSAAAIASPIRASAPTRYGRTESLTLPSARLTGRAKNARTAAVASACVRPATSTPETVTPSAITGGGTCALAGAAAVSAQKRTNARTLPRPTIVRS